METNISMQKSTATFSKPLQSKKIDHELSQRLVYANQQEAVIVPLILLTSRFYNVFIYKHLESNASIHDGFDVLFPMYYLIVQRCQEEIT
jgi:hypothetical protein